MFSKCRCTSEADMCSTTRVTRGEGRRRRQDHPCVDRWLVRSFSLSSADETSTHKITVGHACTCTRTLGQTLRCEFKLQVQELGFTTYALTLRKSPQGGRGWALLQFCVFRRFFLIVVYVCVCVCFCARLSVFVCVRVARRQMGQRWQRVTRETRGARETEGTG